MMIQEYVGRVMTGTQGVSIARVLSPAGRVEPGKTPEFDEYAIVLTGTLRVESQDGAVDVCTGQAVIARHGKWIRYSTPEETEYISVCLPAFAPRWYIGTGNKDEKTNLGSKCTGQEQAVNHMRNYVFISRVLRIESDSGGRLMNSFSRRGQDIILNIYAFCLHSC